jgi:VanZ family protein
MTPAARPLVRFGFPVAWMGVIALLSGDVLSAQSTGSLLLPLLAHLLPGADPALLHVTHVAVRKLGHLVEYGILAALWWRALAPGPGAAGRAVLLAALYAGVDEWRQGLGSDRTASLLDVAIDTAGAGVAVGALELDRRAGRWMLRGAAGMTGLGALGSLAAAGLDWSLGLPARDLLVAGLGLAAATGLLRHGARRLAAGGAGGSTRPAAGVSSSHTPDGSHPA